MKSCSAIVLIALLIFMPPLMVKGQSIPDVPSNHWAYESVSALIEKGFFALFDDGTFRGSETVTRYQIAEIIYRVIQYIETTETPLAETDVTDLRNLTVEFRSELVEIAEDTEYIIRRMQQIEEANLIAAEDLGKFYEEKEQIESDISNLINEIILLHSLKVQLDNLEKSVEQKIEVLQEEVYYLEDYVDERVTIFQMQYDDLESTIFANEERFRELEAANQRLRLYSYGLTAGLIGLIIITFIF